MMKGLKGKSSKKGDESDDDYEPLNVFVVREFKETKAMMKKMMATIKGLREDFTAGPFIGLLSSRPAVLLFFPSVPLLEI